jgi:ElaB/YqjD/DUF883 family membrane-anchored ribosome-binding protein
MNDLTKTLKDAAYVTVGFGVLAFQRAQVRRQELRKQLAAPRQQLETQLNDVRVQVQKLVKDVDERLQPVRAEVEGRIDLLEERLPEQARGIVQQVRTLAKETETQARKLLLVA